MENFLFTVNAVLPLFVLMGVGCLCRRQGLIEEKHIHFINRLSFRVLFPCTAFVSAYSSVLSIEAMRLIGYSLAVYVASFFLLYAIIPHFVKDRQQACVVIHASFRSNIVLFGVSMAYNLFGETGAGPAVLTVATMVPFGNTLSVLLLKLYSGEKGDPIRPLDIARSVVTHPLIIGAVLGICLSMLHLTLPPVILEPIRDLAGSSSPIAMLALGARLNFHSAAAHRNLIAAACLVKLVLLPLAALGIGWMLGFRQYDLGAILIDFAMPAAATVAIMADSEGGDAALAGEIVVFSTAFSCFTLFAWVFFMKSAGLF